MCVRAYLCVRSEVNNISLFISFHFNTCMPVYCPDLRLPHITIYVLIMLVEWTLTENTVFFLLACLLACSCPVVFEIYNIKIYRLTLTREKETWVSGILAFFLELIQ